jgi:hypothetical protein
VEAGTFDKTSFATFSTTPFLKAGIVSTGVAPKIPHTGSAKTM